jgi:SAM-dependent methyltransferase
MDAILEGQVNEQRLEDLAGKAASDAASALGILLSYMGDQTGIYRAMCEVGRCEVAVLADAAGVDGRYLLEWLSAQAAAGYVTYHAEDETFSLSPEQAIVFAEEGHPACLQGFFQVAVAQFATHDLAVETLRTGAGRGWGEHHSCQFCGTDRFFRPGYAANLVEAWLPALDGILAKLTRGGRVADVGCGHGSSTILMAQAFPGSTFVGVDFHEPSTEAARVKAEVAGVSSNTHFVTAGAADYAENDLDLVCMFDALHDMGDPVGVALHIRESLKPDGTLMLVEPLAGDSLSENLHVLGQIFYSASTLICTPASRAQEVGLALGAQAGQARLTEVLKQAGFKSVRRAAETATNMVLEARA